SLLDPSRPTCTNTRLLFALSYIANLTSLLSSLRKILENLYCLSKRGVVVHPKVSRARIFFLRLLFFKARTRLVDVVTNGAEEDAANEMVADVIDQACGAAESVADQADAEEAVDQGSPAGVSK
ncbi:unnamed protein product, partial [Prunus brigantina]